jgi:hypothetical protein
MLLIRMSDRMTYTAWGVQPVPELASYALPAGAWTSCTEEYALPSTLPGGADVRYERVCTTVGITRGTTVGSPPCLPLGHRQWCPGQ